MFESLGLVILKIEGLGNIDKGTCNIFFNDDLFESLLISEIDQRQNFVLVPGSGNLKITIDENTVLASLQFSVDIVKSLGYHWLPLFTNEFDSIQEVPEQVRHPRVLVIFKSDNLLAPVLEITETSEVSENIEEIEDSVKNLDLRVKVLELEQVLQMEKLHQIKEIEKLSKEFLEALKQKNEQIEILKIYKQKFLLASQENHENSKISAKLREENEGLALELKETQKKYLEFLNTQASSSNLDQHKYQPEVLKSFSITPEVSLSIPSEKKQKNKLISFKKSTSQKTDTDSLDLLLNNSLKSLKLEGFLQRLPETYYKTGSKKVGIFMKNNKIYCKFGDTFKTLENFIYSHCAAELEDFLKTRAIANHKRSFSGCVQVLSFDTCRFSVGKASKKSFTPSRSRDGAKPNVI